MHVSGFRVSFTPLTGVLFTVPSRYSSAIGRCRYLALESGLPSFRRPSTGAAVLAHQNTGATTLRVRVSHPLRTRFPVAFLSRVAVPAAPLWESPPGRTTPNARRPQPHACVKFGLVRVRSPLLAESLSFPRGTKMFQFPRFPLLAYRFNEECRPITADGLPHSGTLGSLPALRLPKAFRSAPRPSSACNAKASTSDACSLTGIPVSVISVLLPMRERRKNAITTLRRTGGAGPRIEVPFPYPMRTPAASRTPNHAHRACQYPIHL